MVLEIENAGTTKQENKPAAPSTPFSQWVWRPWYAKIWWTLIPVYWIGVVFSRNFPMLGYIYSSAFAGLMNIFMFPPSVLMILSAGYLRERFWAIDWSPLEPTDGDPPSQLGRGPNGLPYTIDPSDPRAGIFWIGSLSNPITRRRRQ